ncbi:CBS domain-containing protein [Candidatus Woesearchaeota archaeon]|nr:CBS domain-containing protein [Candidatus Woesearchaeota archaeon]
MKKSYKIFKLLGIDVELHYSWFLVFLLLAWGLSADFFPHYYPDLTKGVYWAMGLISSLLLFGSVLAHEFSHSLVARKNKINVDKITLFFFGGIAHVGGDEDLTPKKEFKMAIAGPLLSLFLGLVFFAINISSSFVYLEAITYYLYKLNFILAAFNMAPGYPLDGGRVLRSVAWGITKDIKKATKIASKGGKIIAGAMIFFGFIGIFLGMGTLWFVILGFFLYYIAGASYEQMILKEVLSNVKIKEVMVKDVRTVKPDISLSDLFQDHFLKYGTEGTLVAKNKKFLGAITINELKSIPKPEWSRKKVKDLMVPASKIDTAKENDNAMKILNKMAKSKIGVMPVIKNKKLAGAVSLGSLIRYVKLNQEIS